MLTLTDGIVIVVYFLAVAYFGLRAAGRQTDTTDYFLGGRDLPWWAVCFSIVATETSTLTVIGVPAIAYLGSMTFLQLTLGYLIGRTVVSIVLVPMYLDGRVETAYGLLGTRFGKRLQATSSVTFLITRLLADGVRLFATAIPIRVIALSAGFDFSYPLIISAIALVTVLYTFVGGLKAVVWMDVVQMIVYVGGAVVALGLLLVDLPADWWASAVAQGKTQVFDFTWSVQLFTKPYAFATAVVGGAVFSMASHGTDHLIVQRLLACRSVSDARRALIGSAFLVMIQFAVFLSVGLLLWVYYDGVAIDVLGIARADEVFPKYIVEQMPSGIAGLLLAGILAAAMSTLSSSLNALASSTIGDLFRSKGEHSLVRSRLVTLAWGIVFVVFASLFQDRQNPVVEIGLSIAAFTYGGLLGAFMLAVWTKRPDETDALVAFCLSIAAMIFVVKCVWLTSDGNLFVSWSPEPATAAALGLKPIAWPWYTAVGASIAVLAGSLLSLRHRNGAKPPDAAAT